MGFWGGSLTGLFAGANIGVVVAGLLAGAKREERSEEHRRDPLNFDQAVMNETLVETSPALKPSPVGTPEQAHPC